jgi:membrane-associated phospholipid phosphatase
VSSLARFGVRALLAATALLLVAVPFGLLLFLVQDHWDPLLDADQGARDGLHAFAVDHAWFVSAMKAVSLAGNGVLYWIVFGAVAVWLATRGLKRLSAFVVVTVLGSALLNQAVKHAVRRSRPVLPDPVAHAGGLSFPSGHAQSATVAMLVLLLVFAPVLRGRSRGVAVVAAVAWVVLVSFSRVALGVHYASDVLAGIVLGAAWVAATTALFSAWRREEGRPPVDADRGLEPESAPQLR